VNRGYVLQKLGRYEERCRHTIPSSRSPG
jgi:hypothetical protein